MAKGVLNIITDKIFPATAPGNQTENNSLKSLLFSQPITKGDADESLNHIAGKFVEQQTSARRTTVAVKSSGDDEPQKTVSNFYKEILEKQPFDAESLSKKKISVVLETKKPAAEMTLADYNTAKDRAFFKEAGYSILTDEEIRMAVSTIEANGSVNHNDTLENLRRIDNKRSPMFVSTDRATIEYAKRAGQAVLQYQEYKAKQSDANRERAQNEVNQMFTDQGRVIWNSAVNIVEGTINTALDAASANGGTNPIPLLNPNRPQVDFSSAKTDYRSEMMRRALDGKLDGDGIKRGQATELGVTIAAPFVIGAAITPKTAPQSLKTLGGIPEIEVSTAQTTQKIGRLEIEQGRKLSPSEQRFADKMAAEGKVVKARKEVNQQGVKNPDFDIDKEIIEFKYVSDLKGTTVDKLSARLSGRILDGGSQASKVTLDVTDQVGMTREIAERGISRAFGNQAFRGSNKIKEVRIYGKDFDITIPFILNK